MRHAESPAVRSVYEDDFLLAISKPIDTPFHSENDALGIVEQVRSYFGSKQLYPAHRLDRVTSGLLLFAKDADTNSALSRLFEQGKIEKRYIAVSQKQPVKKQGWIKGDMAKSRNGSYKLLRSLNNPARTRFYAKKLNPESGPLWYFWLMPHTGKTHQLRVACKALGAPILGDLRYGGASADRCYLHAYSCRFQLHGKQYYIEDGTPAGNQFVILQQEGFVDRLKALEIP